MMHLFALLTLNLKRTQQRFLIKIPKLLRLSEDLVAWGVAAHGKARAGEEKAGHSHEKTENIHIEDVFIHHSLSPWLALLGSHYHIIVSFTKRIKTSGNCKEMEKKRLKDIRGDLWKQQHF